MTNLRSAPRRSSLLFTVAVAVLVAVLAAEAFLVLRPKPARPPEAQRAIAEGSNEIVTFGQPSAPMKVELYAPLTLEWHQRTIELLRQYDQAHPGRIHVTLMPMGRSDCDTEMEKRGHTCATLFINGKTEFTLHSGKKVTLEKRPNAADSFYNSEDVITILDQLWGKGVR
jgi:hypothetical protein